MSADAAERQRAQIHSPTYERAGNAKDAGRVFGCHLRIVGEYGNSIGGGKPVKQISEGRQGGGG